MDKQIEELDNLGFIELSDAYVAYPVVFVAKRDGSMRLCIDFRHLNSVTKHFDYPVENITELINRIGTVNIGTAILYDAAFFFGLFQLIP